MHVVYACLKIKPEYRTEFLEAFPIYARDSVEKEDGCLRFDILEAEGDCDGGDACKEYYCFPVYEVYKDKEAYDIHVKTPHVQKISEIAGDWFFEAPNGLHCTNIFPTDGEWK